VTVRALELDFVEGRRTPGKASWLLLTVALAFAADLAYACYSLRGDVVRMEAQLAKRPSVRGTADRAPDEGEILFARETIRRIATPWDRLFAALELARNERVSLLAIEPDAEARRVALSAEATDYLAALTYVANLEHASALKEVRLVRHETPPGAARLAFTVSAQWREIP
jgi:hypothetical protein